MEDACENGRDWFKRWWRTFAWPEVCGRHLGLCYVIATGSLLAWWTCGCIGRCGFLILNADKTKLLTTQAQPPKTITTPRGVSVAVVDRDGCHKWFGCILSGNNKGSHRPDLEYHLQAASRAFFANRNILCNKAVSLRKRLHFFDKIITPVACFAAGHRKIYKTDLDTMDVNFRRLLRSVVGPPAKQTGWTHGTKFYMTGMLG